MLPPPKCISVLLVDDHVVVRQALGLLLRLEQDLVIAGEARTGREAIEMAHKLAPDVVLMDIAMPSLNGLEATKQIIAAAPTTRIIILSAYSDDEYVARSKFAGAFGFLAKQNSAQMLLKAIREVAEGRKFFGPALTRRPNNLPYTVRGPHGLITLYAKHLTSRELEVLQMVAEGMANRQIATELGLSIKTVEKHRQNLMDKLNIHDTAGLTRYALSAGVIENLVHLTIT